jgi:transcription elongation factor
MAVSRVSHSASSNQTVGVIFKTERDSFRVLDQNGQVRLVQPHQISMRRDSNRAIATDAEGYELRVGDNMKENEGEVGKILLFRVASNIFPLTFAFVGQERSRSSRAPILLCVSAQP